MTEIERLERLAHDEEQINNALCKKTLVLRPRPRLGPTRTVDARHRRPVIRHVGVMRGLITDDRCYSVV